MKVYHALVACALGLAEGNSGTAVLVRSEAGWVYKMACKDFPRACR
jgi:hypothetical protein